jgi:hypothetical protein
MVGIPQRMRKMFKNFRNWLKANDVNLESQKRDLTEDD